MVKLKPLIVGTLLLGLIAGSTAAAVPKIYRVTGQVLQVTTHLIVIQKGNKRFEFARDRTTKVTGDLELGSQVTIRYRKTAVSAEVGPVRPAAKANP